MIIGSEKIAELLDDDIGAVDPLIITPKPNIKELIESGSASVDLRLGSWFIKPYTPRVHVLNVYAEKANIPTEEKLIHTSYVPFGEEYILHPKAFVLGITLEWIRLPQKYAGYVVGRSSWGRYGLIIATATGVHPGFSGCLTLEITNVGEIPIIIKPGTTICQLFIHNVFKKKNSINNKSTFSGHRKPILSAINLDEIALKLARKTY